MGFNLTRMIYDDLMMPLVVEMYFYDVHSKMEKTRKIQVILGLISDFLTGTLLLYLFYNNAARQLVKRRKIRERIAKKRAS